ncbi:MAG: RDD family protein [Promethearchaeota archaeon]
MTHRYKRIKRNKNKTDKKKTMVFLEHATIMKRILAYLIDLILLALPYTILCLTVLQGTLYMANLHFGIIIVGGFLYSFLFTWLKHGTPGQLVLELYVVPTEILDEEISEPFSDKLPIKQTLLHCFGKNPIFILIDFFGYEFFKRRFSDPNIHRISQRLAKTSVVFELDTYSPKSLIDSIH